MNVLVFGVFDMLHPGHIYFLEQAQKLGDQLHICLASDEYVVILQETSRHEIISPKEKTKLIKCSPML
jgi:FAD synthetase